MAIYTRAIARETARLAQKTNDYTIVAAYAAKQSKVHVKLYPKATKDLKMTTGILRREYKHKILVISGKELSPKLMEYKNSLVELEDVLYKTINKQIQDTLESWLGNYKGIEQSILLKESTFYVFDKGYNKTEIMFFAKVRENSDAIWLQEVGSSKVKGSETSDFIVPNPKDIYPTEPKRVYKIRGTDSVQIGNKGLADVWNGKPVEQLKK